MKLSVTGCFTCPSDTLMGSPRPMKATVESKPSPISLKVLLCETKLKVTSKKKKKLNRGTLSNYQQPPRIQGVATYKNYSEKKKKVQYKFCSKDKYFFLLGTIERG